jgi:undecaprenyl phosphate-alpha-L-ara4N flippase subunit ArnE
MNEASLGVLLVVVCAIIEGFAQVFLKKSAIATVRWRWRLWIFLGMAAFGVQAVVYTKALQFLEVSTAYPIGSLSFVAVTILSQRLLREKVTRTRWIGVCLILFGVSLVVAYA